MDQHETQIKMTFIFITIKSVAQQKNNIELPKQIIPIVVNGVRGSLEASYCVVCDVTLEKLVVDGSNDKVRSFPALQSSLALCLSTHPLRQRAQKATDANG